MKLSNTEIANSVIEKLPELDFYKVLDDIDITRTPAQEARFISKAQAEELISEYLVFFETKIEAEEDAAEEKRREIEEYVRREASK